MGSRQIDIDFVYVVSSLAGIPPGPPTIYKKYKKEKKEGAADLLLFVGY